MFCLPLLSLGLKSYDVQQSFPNPAKQHGVLTFVALDRGVYFRDTKKRALAELDVARSLCRNTALVFSKMLTREKTSGRSFVKHLLASFMVCIFLMKGAGFVVLLFECGCPSYGSRFCAKWFGFSSPSFIVE